jgi:uncharacterized protein
VVTREALQRYVVAHQGFATRFRRGGPADVEEAVRRLSCVQLDSIATVDRSHRLVLASRVGAVPPGPTTARQAAGRLFEYWAHEACLLPVQDWPLFRRRMREYRVHRWWGPVIDSQPELAARVLGEVRERGPLGSADFDGAGGGGMWNLKPEKRMLDALWTAGELVIAGRRGFQRQYDLPERVLPDAVLGQPEPTEAEWLRGLILRAVHGRGALTESGVREHYRLKGGAALTRPHVEALLAEGRLLRVKVDDGGPDVLVPAETELDGAPSGSVLLSPFENLLWDRPFTERLFGFRHVIEVYKRGHEREFGYYVLPLLVGDRLVGRADLKADRAEGVLRVRAFHREPGVRASGRLDDALDRALDRLARTIGLERVAR